MIKKSLISLMYEAASIQRWNDHIRPWTGFTELDKQAHKMFYAYVLAKCEGESLLRAEYLSFSTELCLLTLNRLFIINL